MRKLIAVFLICIFILSGCSSNNNQTEDETLVPETTIPFSERRPYDWNSSVSETEAERVEKYIFEFSSYAVTDNCFANFSEDGYEAYMNVVDAIYAYETSVSVNRCDLPDIFAALYESFPPVYLVSSFTFTPDDSRDYTEKDKPIPGTLTINYKHPRHNHIAALDAFYNKAAKILSEYCDPNRKEVSALMLYSYCSREIDDFTGETVNIFDFFTDTKVADKLTYPSGNIQNAVYRYLLLQAKIPCATISGTLYGTTRIWTAVQLGENWYYCDPSNEYTDTQGSGLLFFGMTDENRIYEGYDPTFAAGYPYQFNFTDETIYSGENNTSENITYKYNVSDKKFVAFRDCDFYTLDRKLAVLSYYHRGIGEPDQMTLE